MSRAELLKRSVAAVLVTAAVVFLALAVVENWALVRTFEWRLDVGTLLLSVVAHVVVLAWGVFVWSRVVRHFAGEPVAMQTLLLTWSVSNAARYIPGAVWQFLAAAQVARRQGVSGVRMLASLLVHVGFSLLSAVAIALSTLPLDALGLEAVSPWGVVALASLSLALVHPAVINTALGLAGRASRRTVLRWEGSWLDAMGILFLQVISWGMYGFAFWLFLRSVAPFPWSTLLPATGINAAAFVGGWIVPVAPGGAGFREAAMTGLLIPYVPLGVAAAISILSRLWSIAAELILLLATLLLQRGHVTSRTASWSSTAEPPPPPAKAPD